MCWLLMLNCEFAGERKRKLELIAGMAAIGISESKARHGGLVVNCDCISVNEWIGLLAELLLNREGEEETAREVSWNHSDGDGVQLESVEELWWSGISWLAMEVKDFWWWLKSWWWWWSANSLQLVLWWPEIVAGRDWLHLRSQKEKEQKQISFRWNRRK